MVSNPENDTLAYVLQGGSTVYNMLVERCRKRQVRESLQNHGIKEKFRWRWEKERLYPNCDPNHMPVILISKEWFDTRKDAEKNAREERHKHNEKKSGIFKVDVILKIESCCECTYNIPNRNRGMCVCAFKWKKQNKIMLHEGESIALPELFNYSAIDSQTPIPNN